MSTQRTDRFHGVTGGLAVKAPVKTVATGNITLSGEQTISGVALVAGHRVLLTAQTDAKENGIWIVSTTDWSRAPDMDGGRDLIQGSLVTVIGDTPGTPPQANIVYGVTNAEQLAGVIPSDYSFQPGDVRRYGADEAAADNSAAFRAAAKQAWKQGSANSGNMGAVFAPAGYDYPVTNDVDFRGVRLDFRARALAGTSGAKCYMGGHSRGRNPEQYMEAWFSSTIDVAIPQIEIWGCKHQRIAINYAQTVYFQAYSGSVSGTAIPFPNFSTLYPDWRFESQGGLAGYAADTFQSFYATNYACSYVRGWLGDVSNVILKSGDGTKNPDGTAKAEAGNSGYHTDIYLECNDLKKFVVEYHPEKKTYGHNNIHIYGGLADASATNYVTTSITGTEAAGQTALTIGSTSSGANTMLPGDEVFIEMDNERAHGSTIVTVDSVTQITIADALPFPSTGGGVSSGTIWDGIDIQHGSLIYFHDLRNEGMKNYAIKFGPSANRCVVEQAYTSSYGAYPGMNGNVIDLGFDNILCASEQTAYQNYPVTVIDANSLQMDSDTAPTRYGIKGVGVVSTWDLPQAGKITRTGNKLSVPVYTSFYVSDFIPLHPAARSIVIASWKGEFKTGIRARMQLYDKDRTHIKPIGQLETAVITELEWVQSLGVATEYYLQLTGGGDPKVESDVANELGAVWRDGSMLAGSVSNAPGTLADLEWGYGDHAADSLGFNTVYVRDDSNPPNTVYDFDVELETGIPVASYDATGALVTVTTMYPHGLRVNDHIQSDRLSGTGDLLTGQPGYVISVDSPYTITTWQTPLDFGTPDGNQWYITRADISGLGNTWQKSGKIYVGAGTSKYIASVILQNAYYARLFVSSTGGAGVPNPLLFQSLNVSVRSPSGNSEGGRLGAASSNAPVFNAPDGPPVISGTVTPVGAVVPAFIGQQYIDTVLKDAYIAVGPLAADWRIAAT